MTKNFDVLLESMLAEMMPASMMDDFGPEEMTAAVSKKVQDLPGKSQHWGPLQKLEPKKREEIIQAIIKSVFTEKGNTYTPMADDPEQLKELVKSAITKVAQMIPEFKAGGKWAVQFLADRMANKELLGNVKYTTEGGEEIKKDVTQKEMKAALNKALEELPKHAEATVSTPETSEAAVDPTSSKIIAYLKDGEATEDELIQYLSRSEITAAIEKARKENKGLSFGEAERSEATDGALKKTTPKITAALKELVDSGKVTEENGKYSVPFTQEEGEGTGEVPLVNGEEETDADISDFDKAIRTIDPYYRDTRGSFEKFHGDY